MQTHRTERERTKYVSRDNERISLPLSFSLWHHIAGRSRRARVANMRKNWSEREREKSYLMAPATHIFIRNAPVIAIITTYDAVEFLLSFPQMKEKSGNAKEERKKEKLGHLAPSVYRAKKMYFLKR